MVVLLQPETESGLQELAATTGRTPDELCEMLQTKDLRQGQIL
jgi:hypothetical protein